MNLKTDEALVAAVQNGDLSAFEALVRRYQNKLLRVAYRIVYSKEVADDVVQETLVSLYETIDRVDAKKSFSSYLFAMVRNGAISYLRKKKHDLSLDKAVPLASEVNLIHSIEAHERSKTVHQALNRLPAKYSRVLRMHYFDDVSYEKISHVLQMPLNTVRTHLRRGKKMLKALIRI